MLSVREWPIVEAARASGATDWRILLGICPGLAITLIRACAGGDWVRYPGRPRP